MMQHGDEHTSAYALGLLAGVICQLANDPCAKPLKHIIGLIQEALNQEQTAEYMSPENFSKIIKDNIKNISKIENEVAESLPDFKFCEPKKPPLGLAPPGIVYDLRMREISEAILRYLDPERTIFKEDYRRIAKWAEELHAIAQLMVQLSK